MTPPFGTPPRLIVQIDSLLHVLQKNDKYITTGSFTAKYDMIILDESESLLAHFDEKTLEGKEINVFNFFDELLKACGKMLLMDGDISDRSLSFASSYGELLYIRNTNHETNKVFNLILDEQRWLSQLHADLSRYHADDPNFRVCICTQSSTLACDLALKLQASHPHLRVKRLVGTDSGETKKTPWRT